MTLTDKNSQRVRRSVSFSGDPSSSLPLELDPLIADASLETIGTNRSASVGSIGLRPTKFRVYTRRWVVLLCFITASVVNEYQAVSYSSIPDLVAKWYRLHFYKVNTLSILFDAGYAPLVLPVLWFVRHYGLKWSMVLGSFLNAAGACLKLAAVGPSSWFYLLIGQAINAIAGAVLLSIPSLLSATWFGREERALATSLGILSVNFGIAVSLLVQPILVDERGSTLVDVFYPSFVPQAVASVGIFLAILFLVSSKPPVPPSASSAHLDELANDPNSSTGKTGGLGRWKSLCNRGTVFTVLGFSLVTAQGWSLPAVFAEMLCSFGYTDRQMGVMGFAFTCSGLISTPAMGLTLDKWRHSHLEREQKRRTCGLQGPEKSCMAVYDYRLWTSLTALLAALFMAVFTLLLTLGIDSFFSQVVMWGLAGAMFNAFIPAAVELATELTFPVPEEISMGLLFSSATLASVALTGVYTFAISSPQGPAHQCDTNDLDQKHRSLQGLWLGTAFVALGGLFSLGGSGRYKRFRHECEEEILAENGDLSAFGEI